MNKTFLIVLACGLLGGDVAAQSIDHFKVGTSSAIISPQPGTYIAGGVLNRKFTGTHYKSESPEELLNTRAGLNKLQISKEGDVYLLRYNE